MVNVVGDSDYGHVVWVQICCSQRDTIVVEKRVAVAMLTPVLTFPKGEMPDIIA